MTIKTQVTRAPDAAALAAMHRACFAVAWDANAIRDMLAIQGTVAVVALTSQSPESPPPSIRGRIKVGVSNMHGHNLGPTPSLTLPLIEGGGKGCDMAQPCGFALLRHLGDDAEILTLAVPPASRGKGAGRALVSAMLACAKEQGAQKLFLEVRQSNKAALGLYEAMGFTALSRRRGYYRNEDGSREDALILQCAVDS